MKISEYIYFQESTPDTPRTIADDTIKNKKFSAEEPRWISRVAGCLPLKWVELFSQMNWGLKV